MLKLCIVLALYWSLCVTGSPRDSALIVSAVPWHFEVVNFLACSLHSIGLEVHVWTNKESAIGTGNVDRACTEKTVDLPWNVKNFTSDDRYKFGNLSAEYSSSGGHDSKYTLKVLAYVTHHHEEVVLSALKVQHELHDKSEKILCVSHRSVDSPGTNRICSNSSKCAVIHLTDRVNDFAIRKMFDYDAKLSSLQTFLALYPVYRIQGLVDSVPSNSVRRIVTIQGNAYKRSFPEIFKCMHSIMVKHNMTFTIKLVGEGANKMHPPDELKPYVEHYHNVGNDKFYQLLANSTFLASYLFFTPHYMYNESVATGSVAAAMVAGVPVVAPHDFLSMYPCLQSAPVHRSVARDTNCQSVEAAMLLSFEDVVKMKREAEVCRDYMARKSEIVLKGFLHY